LLLASVLIKSYLWKPNPLQSNLKSDTASRQQVETGKKINLSEVDWQKNRQTLLLVLSTTCHFCTESAPFYQTLTKERGDTRIIAVLPQTVNDGKDYLNKLGVSVDEIKQIPFSSIGIRGTPTLILVDNSGIVKDSWVGKLPNSEEAKVLSRVRENVAQK
jgi:thioredoxin-related protein